MRKISNFFFFYNFIEIIQVNLFSSIFLRKFFKSLFELKDESKIISTNRIIIIDAIITRNYVYNLLIINYLILSLFHIIK